MKSYRMVGIHPEDLDSGRVLGPGETAQLTAEEERSPRFELLVSEGKLVEVPASKRKSDKEAT